MNEHLRLKSDEKRFISWYLCSDLIKDVSLKCTFFKADSFSSDLSDKKLYKHVWVDGEIVSGNIDSEMVSMLESKHCIGDVPMV